MPKRPAPPLPRMGAITPRGQLQDFIWRPGDPEPTIGRRPDSKRQKWGGRTLISDEATFAAAGVGRKATLINTGDLKFPNAINVQIRFANNLGGVANRQPQSPFLYTVQGNAVLLQVTVRRSADATGGVTEDIYQMLPGDVFPIDTVTARQLSVDVEVTGAAPGSTQWVEAIATPIQDIGPTNKVYPYQQTRDPAFVATTAAVTTLLPANSARIQFFVTNTSTDADLLIQFGLGPPTFALPTWAPNPLGTLILPRGTFAVYESMSPFTFKGKPGIAPLPLRGTIYGIWSNAGNGGAMIHEGTAF